MPDAANESIIIRDIRDVSEMRLVERLEKEVWGLNDLDVVPMMQLVATIHAGGILIGAFDQKLLVGFAYGFVSIEDGALAHHSHMLAVRSTHRNRDLGRRLKLAQRERALQQGITRMTWTFDPLQSLNARFNFRKLGAISDRYIVNFYGESTPSFLHRNGTDRLWTTWLLDSRRVRERTADGARNTDDVRFSKAVSLVELHADDSPQVNEWILTPDHERVLIQIPTNISALEQTHYERARAWREATRRAFTDALAANYVVTDFRIEEQDDRRVGVYTLSANCTLEEFE
jgi:predicted GNAT superfamily acetyltransferase